MEKRFKCLDCGRTFVSIMPHNCNCGYRSHKLHFYELERVSWIDLFIGAHLLYYKSVVEVRMIIDKDTVIVKKVGENENTVIMTRVEELAPLMINSDTDETRMIPVGGGIYITGNILLFDDNPKEPVIMSESTLEYHKVQREIIKRELKNKV